MKKILLTFICACAALSLQAQEVSDWFDYEYEGRTFHFHILDNVSRTCETEPGLEIDHLEPPYAVPGNPVEGELTLPSVAVHPENGEEYRVVAIGSNGFIGCIKLTSVTIPESVETIGYDAFAYCTSLQSVSLPSTIKSIESGAFSYCPSLTGISLPESLTKIGALFTGSGLTSIYIPESVDEISVNEFFNCNQLKDINVAEANPVYASVDGVLYSKDKTILVKCPGGRSAFVVPDHVERIAEYALGGNDRIASISLGSSVKKIDENAFAMSTALTSFSFGDSQIESLSKYAFYWCTSLVSIKLPDSLAVIGERAFNGCTSLENVDFGKVKTLGSCSFAECAALESVTLPASVQKIETPVFIGCKELKAINVDEANEAFVSLDGVLYDKNVTTLMEFPRGKTNLSIPASVVEICKLAAEGADLEEAPAMSENIKIVGAGAFRNCTGFTTLTIPRQIEMMGEDAFACPEVTSVYYNMSVAKDLPVNPFGYSMPHQATLYAPKAVAKDLRGYYPWDYFKKILAYDFEDGVEEVAADIIDLALPYEVFDMQGRLVADDLNGLPAGIFIIRQGKVSRKIMVK